MNTFAMPDGRELHFFYTMGVLCDYADYILRNPEGDVSVARALIKKACLMNKAYITANGLDEKPVTEEELKMLPAWAFAELQKVVDEQEAHDSKRSIETKPKNVKAVANKK